jgi:predicted dehydrogenase
MAIHAFDAARYLLRADPVSVYCQSWNPPWSWYAGDANAVAVFEMTGGARYLYQGSWCSPGEITSWNGHWRVSGEHGTALWDGDHDPVGPPAPEAEESPYADVEASLHAFVTALRTGQPPSGEVHENLMSLVMVEAAVLSAAAGQPMSVEEVLARAYAQALREETRDDVREQLTRGGLRATAPS